MVKKKKIWLRQKGGKKMIRVSNMDFYGENTVQEEMEDTTENREKERNWQI